uniref:Tyrosine-protein kinase n=2 Tax=Caenorhabditis japonica TaxID=281687 RepID=A0A8R1IL29_CAEJA
MTINKSIEKEQYYHGLLQREDLQNLLTHNGDYLIRMAEPKPGEKGAFVLSVMYNNAFLEHSGSIKHFVIKEVGNKFTINDRDKSSTIQHLIDFHRKDKGSIQPDVNIIRPIMRQMWELDHDSVTIQRKLGEGAFGEVSMGTLKLKKSGKTVKVAIKQAKMEKVSQSQIKEFMREARVMRSLSHPNVVKFYGVAAGQEPLYMVMELATNGSLDSYLRKNTELGVETQNEMVMQAAWGLEYLHSKPLLHRDVAARNCLYGDGQIKISDFGLSRPGIIYQMERKQFVPVRWLAVETLNLFVYTPKTDVWSYGILCWEIYNAGATPYPNMTLNEVSSQVRGGYRMELPPTVSPDIAGLIIGRCWVENPIERFSMSEITDFLQRRFGMRRPNFERPEVSREGANSGGGGAAKALRTVIGKKKKHVGRITSK